MKKSIVNKTNIVLKCVLYLSILVLCFLLPSINNNDVVYSTITSKTFFLFKMLTLVSFSMIMGLLLKGNKVSLRISKIDFSLGILLIFIIINRYFLQPYYGLSFRFLDLLGLFILYVLLRTLPTSLYPWIFISIILSGSVQVMYGTLQVLGFYPSLNLAFKISGSYFNPGPYAGFLATVWTVALGTYLFKERILNLIGSNTNETLLKYKMRHSIYSYIPLSCMAIILIVLPATQSRGSILAIAAGSSILLASRYDLLGKFRAMGLTKSVLLVFTFGTIFFTGLLGLYNFKKDSADGRLLIWNNSINIIKENRFIGVGFDRFRAHYMDAQAKYFQNQPEAKEVLIADNAIYAFNELLQFTVENGLIGFILLIAISIVVVKTQVLKQFLYFKFFCLAIITTVLMFGLVSYPTQILSIKLVFVVTLAFLGNLDVNKIVSLEFIRQKIYIRAAISIVGIFLVLKVNSNIRNIEEAFINWKRAMNIYYQGDYSHSLIEFQKAFPALKDEGDFLMNYGKAQVMATKAEDAIITLDKAKHHQKNIMIEIVMGDAYRMLGFCEKAETCYQKAAYMIPNRFYPEYLLAKLYEETGQTQKMKNKALYLLNKKVKVQSKAIEEMKNEMNNILK